MLPYTYATEKSLQIFAGIGCLSIYTFSWCMKEMEEFNGK